MSNLTFQSLGLNANHLKSLAELGFSTPTEIQQKVIPLLLKANIDLVGQAQTGTGKTLAFIIPILEKLDPSIEAVQAIILSPTRELAFQIETKIKEVGKYSELKSMTVYGGVEIEPQIKKIKQDKPQIIVGTPGRVLDLLKKNILRLNYAQVCVLDEADEMLKMGFVEDVDQIINKFNKNRNILMFSATLPKAVSKLIDKYLKNPQIIKINSNIVAKEEIEQSYYTVRAKHMKEALARLIDCESSIYAMVFCRTKIETREVCDDLIKRGHSADVLNGDMAQLDRDLVMKRFKSKKTNILVCTDVAARGIDVNNLTHVINFGLPRDNESYVHRIGRTARAGEVGKAYLLIENKYENGIKEIEKHIKSKITKSKLPTIVDLKEKLVKKELTSAFDIYKAIQLKGEDFNIDPSFKYIEDHFSDISQRDLLKLMFVWKFNKDFRHYGNLEDIEKPTPLKKKKKKKKS